MKSKPSFLKKYLFNVYVIAIVIFILFISFFIEDSLLKRSKLSNQIDKLKAEKEYYEIKIKENIRKTKELTNNKASLEKFAREQYGMKEENEDVYIIIDD